MDNLHINRPTSTKITYLILKKHKRRFEVHEFNTAEKALKAALKVIGSNFRIFRQLTADWYDPVNEEVIKIGRINKEGR